MDTPTNLNIGLVLLSPDLRVIGLNDFARKVFSPASDELGEGLLSYHPPRSRERVQGIMREMIATRPGEARTVVIDVLGRAIMNKFESRLKVKATTRNFNTVTQLIQLSS